MRTMAETTGDHVLDTTTDGLRIVEPNGSWALVIPDSARPVTRIWAEGDNHAASQAILDKWSAKVARVAH
ncbi:hypothetical protein BIV25_44950 [Streptomyces sp. MUSC 14]|uniref:hypothetical protein n=1 Tax=Streptomyces sp. MUSC 14 TaxID=1354889 RepID=UPI0008F5ECBB|nr:hypothetical protein [Streptomyces sp. MUSC 14]OIJ85097.1 hypothetical protein BIV25_44950 [Streptomyces sp. MUSC 14]